MIKRAKSALINTNIFYFTKDLFSHPLFSGSVVMIAGSNLANAFAYLYHLVVGRMLGPSDYGSLVAILSVLTMVSSSFTFIGLVIVKFVSAAKEEDLKPLFVWFAKRGMIIGLVLGVPIFVATPLISNFLHVDTKLTLLIGPIVLLMILSMIMRSFLQGLLKFLGVAITVNMEMISRLLVGVTLIYFGFDVFGAIVGIAVSIFLSFAFSYSLLKGYKIFGKEKLLSGQNEIFAYSLPIFIGSLASNSFFSTDVVLVKHFFDGAEAGIYGSISTLGKIIFFGAAPVSSVMFPMVSKRHAKGGNYVKVFLLSVLMVLAISLAVLFVFLIFSQESVSLLYGDKFIGASDNLFYFGVFMLFYTLSATFVNYFLSIKKTKIVFLVLLGAVLQAVGIYLFHDTIRQVISVSLVTSLALLISTLIYFVYVTKKDIKKE